MNEQAVFQVVGYKNTGKTTLICRLIARLAEKGLRVGTVKHDAHQFEVDQPGRDTWKHREAGAQAVAISSASRTAFIEERSTSLEDLLRKFHNIDIVLVEGFKFEKYAKIVILKSEEHLELLHSTKNIKGMVSWFAMESLNSQIPADIPCFRIEDEDAILELILHHTNLK
ncbi:MAG: molybdopterin-guanine dinucleotide biosynthesis protein [Bacilli bacterium]|nr:molybdopterin-guanine dinucleotide biosynthesis protein [Bacilli bacterium]